MTGRGRNPAKKQKSRKKPSSREKQEQKKPSPSHSVYFSMTGKGGYTYILSNKTRTTLYIGVTANLYARIQEHKACIGSSFTQKYRCTHLLWFEFYSTIEEAILKEKQLKKWKREWKDSLIKNFNPHLADLSGQTEDLQ